MKSLQSHITESFKQINESKDIIRVSVRKGGFELKEHHKKVLNSVFQAGFDKTTKKLVDSAEFFNSGYKGISFGINGTKYLLVYSSGHVGLEDQTMGSISLQIGSNIIWKTGQDYHKSSFGHTDVSKKNIEEAKKLFKNFIDSFKK